MKQEIKLQQLDINDQTYEMHLILNSLASLYNDILNEMDITFIITENHRHIKETKKYIEKIYRFYEHKLLKEGLHEAKAFYQELETGLINVVPLDNDEEVKKFEKKYPLQAEQLREFYIKVLSYPTLEKEKASYQKHFNTHGTISIPKNLREDFLGAKKGELLFFFDAEEEKRTRIERLDKLVIDILKLNNTIEELPLDFEITGLVEMVDLEKVAIKKYLPYDISVMYIKAKDAIFELYSSELDLPEILLKNHIRMIDRDGQLFSSIQSANLKNQIIFKGPEQVKNNIQAMKNLVKEKKLDLYQISLKK